MRVGHHQPPPPGSAAALPPIADRPRDRPHPEPGIALHPAAGQDELLLPRGRAAPAQPARARPGIKPAPPAVYVILALQQQDRDRLAIDLAEQVLGVEPAHVGHRQGQAVLSLVRLLRSTPALGHRRAAHRRCSPARQPESSPPPESPPARSTGSVPGSRLEAEPWQVSLRDRHPRSAHPCRQTLDQYQPAQDRG